LPVIGLTGTIGAGKSRVAAELAGLGAFVLDADQVGHALLDQRPTRAEVVARFGPLVLDPDHPDRVDRKALGRIVFADPQALRDLEAIVHPRMRRTFEKAIARVARRREHRAVVLDAAILLEAGWDDLCDLVLVVDAPRPVRLERVRAQRGWTDAQFEARERSQWPAERKRARADQVLENDADEPTLIAQVRRFWRGVRGRTHAAAPTPVPTVRRLTNGPTGTGSGRTKPIRPRT
jgi:dephospho-CoA kinase